MDRQSVIQKLKNKYIENPQILSTSFYKFANWILMDNSNLSYSDDNFILHLQNAFYHQLKLEDDFDSTFDYNSLSTIVTTSDWNHPSNWRKSRFFKLHKAIPTDSESQIYDSCFKSVEVDNTEIQSVLEFLNKCYSDMNLSIDMIQNWRKENVFRPELWRWAIDINTGEKIGLGIAQFDSSIGEGILDWIQVLPDRRGKGVGSFVIREIEKSFPQSVSFITVSGDFDNQNNPNRLYSKCGYNGNVIWNVYRKADSSS